MVQGKVLSKSEFEFFWQVIGPCKMMKAENAREAAEMVKGGPLSDEEWEKVGWKWEQAWASYPTEH